MEENNNKRFYWIKLRTDFFEKDTIDFLMGQPNGAKYVVLYQMLCIKSANNGGYLGTKFGESIIPYDVNKIVRDTKYFDVDTVRIALELYKNLGLIYQEENNNLYKITNVEQLVGSESANKEAVRKREQRLKEKGQQFLGDGTKCPKQMGQNVPNKWDKMSHRDRDRYR